MADIEANAEGDPTDAQAVADMLGINVQEVRRYARKRW